MLAFCAPDIVHVFNVDPDRDGNGDVLVGHVSVQEQMRRIRAEWEELDYQVVRLREAGNMVTATVEFRLRRRNSNQVIESTKRQEWKVEDGRIVALFETLDAGMITAFRKMSEVER